MYFPAPRFHSLVVSFASLGLTALTASAAQAQVQDLYVSSFQNGTISQFAGTGTESFATTATTLSSPSLMGTEGLTFDKRGDLFAASQNGNNITEFAAGAKPGSFGATIAITGGLNGPNGLAFDSHGNLFVSNVLGDSITEFARGVSPGTFAAPVVSPFTLPDPSGLAFDSRGDLFVASPQNNTITEFLPGPAPGGFSTAVPLSDPSLNGPSRLAFDSHGDLFAANTAPTSNGAFTITELPAGPTPGTYGATETLYDPTLSRPAGLAFDARGDLFVTNIQAGDITEFAATGAGTFAAGTVIESGLVSPTYLTFGPAPTFSPAAVPEASTTVSFGLLLALGMVFAAKKRRTV